MFKRIWYVNYVIKTRSGDADTFLQEICNGYCNHWRYITINLDDEPPQFISLA